MRQRRSGYWLPNTHEKAVLELPGLKLTSMENMIFINCKLHIVVKLRELMKKGGSGLTSSHPATGDVSVSSVRSQNI